MSSLRILVLSNKCPPDFDGGYELRAFQIAEGLRSRGHHVDFVTSKYRPAFKGERSDPPWVHRIFHYVLVSRSKTAWRKIDRLLRRIASTAVARRNVPAMERFLEGRSYDIAYCFGLHRVSLAVTGPLVRRGIPILWHAGGTFMVDHLRKWPREIPGYQLSMQLFARKWYAMERRGDYRHVAFVSDFLRDYFVREGMTPERSWVISRGIDFPLARDIERSRTEPPVFFMACRLDEEKGVHHAIAAGGMLLREHPELPWRLEISGVDYSDYGQRLKAQVSREGLNDRVAFVGHLPHSEVLKRMRTATAFLFCSIYGEPFSSTIIEALASGTPLIGSDAGSILEVVEREKTALVYPRENPAALAGQMQRVLVDPALRLRLARAGVELIAARYTLDRILAQTEATFAEVMKNQRAALREREENTGPALTTGDELSITSCT